MNHNYMWMQTKLARGLLILALMVLATCAHATLHERGNGMVYDDTLDITWLTDFGYAKTSGYDEDGMMTHDEALKWAAQLDYAGYTDWRLPKLLNPESPCLDLICPQASELSVLFYDTWRGQAMHDYTEAADRAAVSLFSNVQLYFYYLQDSFTGDPTLAWRFDLRYGALAPYYSHHYVFATAVRNGDSSVLAVPEVNTWWLLLVGLAVVVFGLIRDGD